MNQGLSSSLKLEFPNTKSIAIPVIDYEGIAHPNWLVGFIDGEGSFYVKVTKNESKSGYSVSIIFTLSQHLRDEILMSKIVSYLDCGIIEKSKGRFEVRFILYKFNDILL